MLWVEWCWKEGRPLFLSCPCFFFLFIYMQYFQIYTMKTCVFFVRLCLLGELIVLNVLILASSLTDPYFWTFLVCQFSLHCNVLLLESTLLWSIWYKTVLKKKSNDISTSLKTKTKIELYMDIFCSTLAFAKEDINHCSYDMLVWSCFSTPGRCSYSFPPRWWLAVSIKQPQTYSTNIFKLQGYPWSVKWC